MKLGETLRDALRGPRAKATWILLVTPPLLLVWKVFASPANLAELLAGGSESREFVGGAANFLSGFLLLGVVPALIVKLAFRERLRDYGVGLGHLRSTVIWLLIGGPLFMLAAWIGSGDPTIRAAFPLNTAAGDSPNSFALHAVTYLLYYAGWEFCFRGFLLFGLRDAFGDVHAVLIQVLASALLHIGSPAAETFGAIPAGVLWGLLALQTRSLLAGLGQHYLLGITLDAILCLSP